MVKTDDWILSQTRRDLGFKQTRVHVWRFRWVLQLKQTLQNEHGWPRDEMTTLSMGGVWPLGGF